MDVEKVVALATEVKEFTADNLPSVIEKLQSIYDDPTELVQYASLASPIKNFLKAKAPFLYPSWRFWNNVDAFFNSGVLDENDKKKLIDKLSNDKNKNDSGKEIINIINKINTDKKMAYILNATKVLLTNDSLDLPLYFRICRTIFNTLEEDLEFLSHNIEKNSIKYSIKVNGLMTTGLVYDKGLSEDNSPSYAFNEFAKVVYEYALKGNGEKKIEEFNLNRPPQTSFLTTADIATDEEMNKMLDEVFGNNK